MVDPKGMEFWQRLNEESALPLVFQETDPRYRHNLVCTECHFSDESEFDFPEELTLILTYQDGRITKAVYSIIAIDGSPGEKDQDEP